MVTLTENEPVYFSGIVHLKRFLIETAKLKLPSIDLNLTSLHTENFKNNQTMLHSQPAGEYGVSIYVYQKDLDSMVEEIVTNTIGVEPVETVPKFKYDALVKELEMKEATIAELDAKIATYRNHNNGMVWYWDPDRHNDLESLTCPIVIEPDVLRRLFGPKP